MESDGDLLLTEELRASLGPEMKMDVHLVDVRLKSGRRINNVVVRGGRFLTGVHISSDSLAPLDFSSEEILSVTRHGSNLPRLLILLLALIGLFTIALLLAGYGNGV